MVHLKRAVHYFQSQTYSNKELIVVCQSDDIATLEYLQQVGNIGITCAPVDASQHYSLGALRNIGIQHAKGEFICQWDDDDWYHCDRIRTQMQAVHHFRQPGCILTNWFIFDRWKNVAYLSFIRWLEGSVLFSKSELVRRNISYPSIEKKEDMFFINRIINESKILPLVCPYLYIYIYHGSNTWQRAHFEHNFNKSQRLSAVTSNLIAEIVNGDMPYLEASSKLQSPEIMEEMNFLYSFRT